MRGFTLDGDDRFHFYFASAKGKPEGDYSETLVACGNPVVSTAVAQTRPRALTATARILLCRPAGHSMHAQ